MPKRARGVPINSAAVRRGAELAEMAKAELREEIHRRRLVAADLARDLGHTRSFLSNLFSDRSDRKPSGIRLETVLTLLDLLDIDPGDFFSRVTRTGAASPESPSSNAATSPSSALGQATQRARDSTVSTLLDEGLSASAAQALGEVAADLVVGLLRVVRVAHSRAPLGPAL